MSSKIVGLGAVPAPSKKAAAQAKKLAAQPAMNPHRGQDPTVTVVEKAAKAQHEDDVGGRPDKAAYDREQDTLKAQIEVLQKKQNEVKEKIAGVSGKGASHDRKVALRAELDSLRAEQAKAKGGRGKTLDQVKMFQDNLSKIIADLQAQKAKLPYKSVAEVDGQIKNLERQIESGTMKLVDEKKALAEISALKKSRKTVESFGPQQAAIDEEKARIDSIRASLNDPAVKALSDKFNKARAELDGINKQHDEASKGRDALFDQRNELGKQLDELWGKKKASAQAFREANNKFYDKLTAARTARLERQKNERQAYEDSKKNEINERLLEEAQAPAFEREIEDCQTLIDFFQRRIGQVAPSTNGASTSLFSRAEVKGVPKLEGRQVDSALPAGAVALKKKGEQEEEVWGGSTKKKGKGAKKIPLPDSEAAPTGDEKLNLPFGTLGGLLSLGISAPLTVAEVPETIKALGAKKAYFVANQDRVTKEKIAAAEKKIAALHIKADEKDQDAPVAAESPAPEPAAEA